jgi:hypothetical protein
MYVVRLTRTVISNGAHQEIERADRRPIEEVVDTVGDLLNRIPPARAVLQSVC